MWCVWVRVEMHAGFWWGNLQERDHLRDLVADERIIKTDFIETGWGIEWVNLALRAVVYTVMNL